MQAPLAETMEQTTPQSTTALVARILLSAIFVLSGFAKLTDPGGAMGYMEKAGIDNPEPLLYIAAVAEILGGLAVLLGLFTRLGAAGLFLYMAVITVIMHKFWGNMPADAAKMQMVQFMKNLCIMGGLAMVVAFGPGRYSLDARLRRRKLL
jgi:putative oxidoreductase